MGRESIKKYHTWIETVRTVSTDKKDIVDSLVMMLGDEIYADLAVRHAARLDRMLDDSSVSADLVAADVHHLTFVVNTAQCELDTGDVMCPAWVMKSLQRQRR